MRGTGVAGRWHGQGRRFLPGLSAAAAVHARYRGAGLQVSYSGVEDKLTQIDAALQRRASPASLGMPSFTQVAGSRD